MVSVPSLNRIALRAKAATVPSANSPSPVATRVYPRICAARVAASHDRITSAQRRSTNAPAPLERISSRPARYSPRKP